MAHSRSTSSSGNSGNLGEDEESISGSGSGSGTTAPAYSGRRFTEDTAFGRAGSPMPELLQAFVQVEDRFRLQREGPRNSSDNLLLVYYDLDNPLRAYPRSQSPPPGTPLDPAVSLRAQTEFRKYAKIAAQSCAWLARSSASEEDVQVAYLSMMQGLDELQGAFRELPFTEHGWIGNSSPQRLPSLLDPSSLGNAPGEIADVTLCNEEDMLLKVEEPSMETPQTPSGSSHIHPPFTPFLPVFPAHTFTVPDDYEGLVVPTSDPREVEYPYMIVPSLETRLARHM